jgi:hypothetical protein
MKMAQPVEPPLFAGGGFAGRITWPDAALDKPTAIAQAVSKRDNIMSNSFRLSRRDRTGSSREQPTRSTRGLVFRATLRPAMSARYPTATLLLRRKINKSHSALDDTNLHVKRTTR